MNYRKFRKNLKAISPIISVLLMIAIAVVASLVVYAWVMGYIGYQTGKTGDSVVIQSVTFSGTSPTEQVATVYVQNVGSTTVTIPTTCLYVNGQQNTAGGTPTTLLPGTTATITDTGAGTTLSTFASGQTVTIKVTTVGGTYSQVTQQAP
jgi:flagellin-like protein